jgi:hypothetical protein
VFRSLFNSKKDKLNGAPPVRRLKTYSAASGYVYQYFYEGYRPFSKGAASGVEYVFSISHDRKNWHATAVLVSEASVHGWETAHERTLSSTERYALAKLALFQAFDERPSPAGMQQDVILRPADVEGIIESLGL